MLCSRIRGSRARSSALADVRITDNHRSPSMISGSTPLIRADPSRRIVPARRTPGLILVAHENGDVLGCAGLRLLPGRIAEVTRVFVVPAARRRGLGSRLLSCLEDHAHGHRVSTLRLDTRRDLTEARRLYARHGYREVPPFSHGPYADHWFEKALS